ncbi:helix-turn-helix domain-containing protein [Thermophagus sp. OGC60D27]|uniref:helix-turn-helix domain-containing protein n=1 Tax=Thermophagus sp. OGC60D27 TaxID=3458415 RepID=UPI004037C59F
MDIMDTARLNIKRRREIKGLRQQDMADKLSMSLRSYQSLESGETKLDIERLERIAEVLETSLEELLRPESVVINQQISDSGNGSGFSTGNTYNYSIENEVMDKMLTLKEGEIQALQDEIKFLKEENEYLRNKVDQLLGMMEKKNA